MQDSTIWFLLAICGLGIIVLALAIFLFLAVLRFSGRGVLGIFSFLANSRLEDTVQPEKMEPRPDLRHTAQTSAQGFDVALMEQQARAQAAVPPPPAPARGFSSITPITPPFAGAQAAPAQSAPLQNVLAPSPQAAPSLIPPGFSPPPGILPPAAAPSSAAPQTFGQPPPGYTPAPQGFTPAGGIFYPPATPGAPAPKPVPPSPPFPDAPNQNPFREYPRRRDYDQDDPHMLGGMAEDADDDFGG